MASYFHQVPQCRSAMGSHCHKVVSSYHCDMISNFKHKIKDYWPLNQLMGSRLVSMLAGCQHVKKKVSKSWYSSGSLRNLCLGNDSSDYRPMLRLSPQPSNEFLFCISQFFFISDSCVIARIIHNVCPSYVCVRVCVRVRMHVRVRVRVREREHEWAYA